MEIRIEPHRGVNCATKKEVDLGQDRIFLDGQVVGYVGRKENSPIGLIFPRMRPEEEQAIEKAVKERYGGEAARKMSRPVPIPDEDEEDYDDADTV